MITVASYLMGIPPGNNNPEKPQLLKDFIAGVNTCGDKGAVVQGWHPMDTDVAVVQGFVHPGSKNVRHLNLRKDVHLNQLRRNKRTIFVDSNLFLAYDKGNSKTYLRYSYDGIFPTTGDYCDENPNPSRWGKLQKDLNITVKPWKLNSGDNILICCQRDGGWSMDGVRTVDFVASTINKIRKYSDRPIVIRFHPGDKRISDHIKTIARMKLPKLRVSTNESIFDDLASARAVVNYNSSPSVVSVIEGVPTFVLDPARSQAAEVTHHDLRFLDSPQEFDREPCLRRLAQFHWTLTELRSGEAWRHLKKYANKEPKI